MSFKLLSDLKSQLEALEKASHGKIEVWADLPAHENDLQNQLIIYGSSLATTYLINVIDAKFFSGL